MHLDQPVVIFSRPCCTFFYQTWKFKARSASGGTQPLLFREGDAINQQLLFVCCPWSSGSTSFLNPSFPPHPSAPNPWTNHSNLKITEYLIRWIFGPLNTTCFILRGHDSPRLNWGGLKYEVHFVSVVTCTCVTAILWVLPTRTGWLLYFDWNSQQSVEHLAGKSFI